MSEKIVDSELTGRKEQRIVTEQADAAVAMSVADRLTRRAKVQTVQISLEDDLGEFIIEMQQPMRREMDELQELQTQIQNENSQVKANESLCLILGKLSIDDSLDYDFWLAGNYNMNDLISIIQKLFESLVEQVKAAQSFRQDADGAGSVPDVRVPGKTPS